MLSSSSPVGMCQSATAHARDLWLLSSSFVFLNHSQRFDHQFNSPLDRRLFFFLNIGRIKPMSVGQMGGIRQACCVQFI